MKELLGQKVYLKENLELFVPSMFKLLENQNISWRDINKKFTKKYLERIRDKEKNDGNLLVAVNFYDVVTQVMNDNNDFIRLLGYFEYTFDELNKNLDNKSKGLVCGILRKLLNDFTGDYLHYIGELSVLNTLTKNKILTLDSIEFPLGNGKFIDFRLFSPQTNQYLPIEVLNIHISESNSSDVSVFKRFIEGKINTKIHEKTGGEDLGFTLVIVLWGTHNDLEKIYIYYKKGFKIENERVFEPFCYLSWYDDQGTLYKFQNISKIYDESNGIVVR